MDPYDVPDAVVIQWFAAWEAAWRIPILGQQGNDFERMKLAVNHGTALYWGRGK